MNCHEFMELPEWEKSVYLASLIHVCQSDSALFKAGTDLIKLGTRKGLFDKVTIMPHLNHTNDTNTNGVYQQPIQEEVRNDKHKERE